MGTRTFETRTTSGALDWGHRVLLPRGNGKTTLMAALAVHHALTVPRPAVYVAAASRDQARVLYEAARDFASHPAIADPLTLRHLELRVEGGHVRVLASDAPKAHGLTPSLAIVDELHAHRDAELYLALRTAMLKRRDARMVTISTAGSGADSALGRLRARALAAPVVRRRGALTEASGATCGCSNGPSQTTAPTTSAPTFKPTRPRGSVPPDSAKNETPCRRWLSSATTATSGPPARARGCHRAPGKPQSASPTSRRARTSGSASTAAASARPQPSCGPTSSCTSAAPSSTATKASSSASLKSATLRSASTSAKSSSTAWRFGQAAQEPETEGLTTVAFPQTDVRMVPASTRLRDAIVEGRLTLPDDDQLTVHAAAAIARHFRRGWRLDKAARSDNIDGIVALAMAVERAQHKEPEAQLVGWL